MKFLNLLIAVPLVLFIAGCATSQKANVYQTGAVQQQMRVKLATVIDVREVDIEPRPTGAGASAGATAGAVIGTNTGRGGVVEGIAGAVIGGVAGAMAEKGLSAKKGQEIVYQVDGTSETLALVQEKDETPLKVGDRVRLIEGSFSARLVKLAQGQ
jgi:outer membrane lipoprotein SlyB